MKLAVSGGCFLPCLAGTFFLLAVSDYLQISLVSRVWLLLLPCLAGTFFLFACLAGTFFLSGRYFLLVLPCLAGTFFLSGGTFFLFHLCNHMNDSMLRAS